MDYKRLRRGLVFAHRYAGLALAAFLILEGLTGSLLAFNMKLEHVFAPQLFATPKPGAARLSLGALAERAKALVPDGQVDYLLAYPNQTFVRVEPRPSSGTRGAPPLGASTPLGFDQLFLDPWTGRELGRRRFGDLSQGAINIMPFVYNLHSDLNAGPTGGLILGIVALIWTIDCFIAVYLTLPAALRGFWKRWKLAWQIKWNVGAFRLNFDLHRASGLWLWPPLLIFAWSSVMLALPSVYDRVTGALFDYNSANSTVAFPAHPAAAPKLDWVAAERVGAALLAKQAALHGFLVLSKPDTLAYIREESVYSYGARTNLDVRGELSDTFVWFDADTGAFRRLFLPRRQHAGNTVSTWLYDLHFADLSNSPAYRALVFVVGIVIAMLAVTGIYIWLKKRYVRRSQLRRRPS